MKHGPKKDFIRVSSVAPSVAPPSGKEARQVKLQKTKVKKQIREKGSGFSGVMSRRRLVLTMTEARYEAESFVQQ